MSQAILCDDCPRPAEHHFCNTCCHAEPDAISRENEALRTRVAELEAALRACVAFIEDDTCRHDYEKRAPLKRAREALGEVE